MAELSPTEDTLVLGDAEALAGHQRHLRLVLKGDRLAQRVQRVLGERDLLDVQMLQRDRTRVSLQLQSGLSTGIATVSHGPTCSSGGLMTLRHREDTFRDDSGHLMLMGTHCTTIRGDQDHLVRG